MIVLLVLGCKGEPTPEPAVEAAVGDLLIEELYYSGAVPAGGTDHYFADQFVELVNTTDAPLDLSGILVGEAFGAAGAINPGMEPDSYAERRPEQVVLDSVWRIPDGTRLEAGATLVIAHDGTNHRPFSTIDLSGAGLEAYVAGSGGDDDHPTVPNLEEVVFNGGYDWLITVFGPSVVLLEADTELGNVQGPFGTLARAPREAVIDAIETVMDADSGAFKRLPATVDSGFAFVDGTYVGTSLHRKRTAEGWQDTDDSGADFEPGPPAPGLQIASDAVYGDPTLELGTGTFAFEPLADDDPIALVAGAQGGWHLDATVRFTGFGPGGVRLVYEAVDTDAQRVSFVTQAELSESSVLSIDERWTRVGDRVVLDIAHPGDVLGQSLVLRVTAELDGQTWSDERVVVVSEP